METIKRILKKVINRETIMYIIFGVLTTVVNWIVYRIFDQLFTNGNGADVVTTEGFRGAIDTFLSKGTAGIIAWVAAVAFAYVTNRLWVFEEKAQGAKNVALECGRFVGARVATGVIEILGTPEITFVTDGGTYIPVQVVKLGQRVTIPETPVKEGYDFGGWFTDSACTERYDFNNGVTGHTTLYAKWTPASGGADDPKPEPEPDPKPISNIDFDWKIIGLLIGGLIVIGLLRRK